MARETGNGVTIGSSVNNNYLYIDWSTVDEPSNNRTLVYWSAGFHYTSSDAQLDDCDISINGLRYDNPGRVKNYAGTFTTRDHGIVAWNTPGYSAFYIDHNSAGEASITISGSIGGSLSARSTISSRSYSLTNYNRSANTPYYNNITRTSATNIYVEYARTGSVNGPTTYVLERATNAEMSANYTTVSEGNQTVNANTTYYYRMYAYGDEGGNKYSGVYGPYHGQPTEPASITPTNPTNSEDRIVVPFSGPSYVGSGISSYTITRSGTNSDGSTSKVFTGITTTPFIDTDSIKVPGNPYNYTIQALTSAGAGYPAYTSNGTTSSNVTSAGPPYSPPSVPTVSSLGLSITVTSSAVTANGGIAINTANTNEGYFVQYQLADTLNGTYGYNGTAGAWSPAVKMSDQTNRQHTYSSMTPAKYYKFRTYAANPVIYGSNGSTQLYYPHNNLTYTANFATTSTGYFLAAGGKRFDGTNWIPTQTAKRFDGTNWVPLTIAKRFDGTNWVPLS